MSRLSLSIFWILGTLLLLFLGSSVHAEGTCGSTISEKVTLKNDLTCGTTAGLIVKGPEGQLDLGGHTVRCRDLTKTIGILLVGEKAQLTNGTVAQCQFGVVATDKGQHRLVGVTSREHAKAGFIAGAFARFLEGKGNLLINNHAENTDGGFVINSQENFLLQNTSRESRRGFVVNANRNKLTLNVAVNNKIDGFSIERGAEKNHLIKNHSNKNAMAGFRIEGDRNKLVKNYATGNGLEMIGAGFRIFGANKNFLAYNKANKNTVSGFEIEGFFTLAEQNVLLGNTANKNGKFGIVLPFFAEMNTIAKNTAIKNGLFDLQDGFGDCEHNKWKLNTFNTPDLQCIR